MEGRRACFHGYRRQRNTIAFFGLTDCHMYRPNINYSRWKHVKFLDQEEVPSYSVSVWLTIAPTKIAKPENSHGAGLNREPECHHARVSPRTRHGSYARKR